MLFYVFIKWMCIDVKILSVNKYWSDIFIVWWAIFFSNKVLRIRVIF